MKLRIVADAEVKCLLQTSKKKKYKFDVILTVHRH